jgi:hypothetical protein
MIEWIKYNVVMPPQSGKYFLTYSLGHICMARIQKGRRSDRWAWYNDEDEVEFVSYYAEINEPLKEETAK